MQHSRHAEILNVDVLAGALFRHIGTQQGFADHRVTRRILQRSLGVNFERETPIADELADVDAFAASAHAHYLGKSMKLVATLPTGEVLSFRQRKSSGHKGYDEAIERAILKSSPLPKPEPANLFERQLELRFRPQDQ